MRLWDDGMGVPKGSVAVKNRMMGWDWHYITLHLRSKHEFPLEKSRFNRAAIEIKPHGIVSVSSGGKC